MDKKVQLPISSGQQPNCNANDLCRMLLETWLYPPPCRFDWCELKLLFFRPSLWGCCSETRFSPHSPPPSSSPMQIWLKQIKSSIWGFCSDIFLWKPSSIWWKKWVLKKKKDPNTKRFKRKLIYFNTNTQYAHFRGNPFCQATKRHLNG